MSYQSSWTGALPNNGWNAPAPNPTPTPQPQPTMNSSPNTNTPMNNQQIAPSQPWMPQPTLVIVPVQSEAVVDNYIVAPGVTAFLINYAKGVFWTKRQTQDGLGFDTIRHTFKVDDASVPQNQNGIEAPPIDQSEFIKLRDEVLKLRHEFDDFMK